MAIKLFQLGGNMASQKKYGNFLLQGGKKLNLRKVDDKFTLRLSVGTTPKDVESKLGVVHSRRLAPYNLNEFSTSELDQAMENARKGKETVFASHVYSFENDPKSRLYLSDQITVKFKPETSDTEIEDIASSYGLEIVKEIEGSPKTYVFKLTPQAKENPIKISNKLKESGKVELSEPNIIIESQSYYIPSDTKFKHQWHLYHGKGPLMTPGSHISAPDAWDITRGERSVVVAVVDDSVDITHRDFQGAGKIIAPVDFRGRDFNPLPESEDDNHGTACAGVAVAEENRIGVVGVAPGCALMPVRTSGLIDDESIEEIFEWVEKNGAHVISCSWGAATNYFPLSLRKWLAIHKAATEGRGGKGCIIVFAAGNSNRPVNGTVNEMGWPEDLYSGPTQWLSGFAAHEDVLAVSACTSLGGKSAYSNWGKEISVCAPSNNGRPSVGYPGIGKLPTYPEITTPLRGRGIVTTDRVGRSGYTRGDYTSTFGGTSSACPVVAGVAALVLSANPELSAKEVKKIIEDTADKIIDREPDPQLKLSKGTYDSGGHSDWFGHGKINAFNAVQKAIERSCPDWEYQGFGGMEDYYLTLIALYEASIGAYEEALQEMQ